MQAMEPNEDMCNSLIKWMQTIVSVKSRNANEFGDGVAILEALMHIAPEHFAKLEHKIKKDVGNNWRLRVSNLKKIIEAIQEYYQEVLTLQVMVNGLPDATEIGSNCDLVHLAKLLRLVLGCAVNCDRKQDFITNIMGMEVSVQQNIMLSIQQLDQLIGGRSGLSLLILDGDSRVIKLTKDLEAVHENNQQLMHQVQQLETQLGALTAEKNALTIQCDSLLEREAKNIDLRKQNDVLKEELFKMEMVRDDLKSKVADQQKIITANLDKIAELQLTANATSHLKDEIDALSESAAKVKDMELALSSYKKKMENYANMKKNLSKVERLNSEYLQRNLELEEEVSRCNSWKAQCEQLRKEMSDLEAKTDEECDRADQAQFACVQMEAKLETAQAEKERLLAERALLREEIEELKALGDHQKGVKGGCNVSTDMVDDGSTNADVILHELTPKELQERLRYLVRENRELRLNKQKQESTQAQLESALSRIDKLQQQKRSANESVAKLELQVKELKTQKNSVVNEDIIQQYQERNAQLEEMLAMKEAKEKRSVEKARQVVQQLQMQETPSIKSNGSASNSTETGEHSFYPEARIMKETEQHLLVSAYNHLSLNCHIEVSDERLGINASAQGQSFLGRHRQATPRKKIGFGSK